MLYSYMTQEQLSHETGNEYSRSTRDLANVKREGEPYDQWALNLMCLVNNEDIIFS